MDLLADYLDRQRTAQALGVSTKTITEWSNQPDGLQYVRIGRKNYYHRDWLRNFLDRRTHKPNPRRSR